MKKEKDEASAMSRRNFVTKAGIFLAGGIAGCASLQLPNAETKTEPPPLPWPWVELDPLEAGRRAYLNYLKNKG